MKKIKKKIGICKLTGEPGTFVKSHIIPRALTLLSGSGEQRIEARIGHRIKKSYNSWFDPELVIRKGEDILSYLDTYAIVELRKHRLIWSGLGSDQALKEEEFITYHEDFNMRKVLFSNAALMRTFFLSLLWRAAASNLKEMADVILQDWEVEDLRQRVASGKPGPSKDYPILLDQITSVGFLHNRTPFIEDAEIPEGSFKEPARYVRFYFDGLVAKIYLANKNNPNDEFMKFSIGESDADSSLVIGRNFKNSRTFDNLKEVVEDSKKIKLETLDKNYSHTRRK